jgi:uncharacterized protein (UPF0332 family)
MRTKALENIRAATSLLEKGTPFPNAATTRAYYAAYHACWSRLSADGYEPPPSGYWPHKTFADEILKAGIVNEDTSESVAFLYSRRVIADYFPDDIDLEEALRLTAAARDVLHSLGIDAP